MGLSIFSNNVFHAYDEVLTFLFFFLGKTIMNNILLVLPCIQEFLQHNKFPLCFYYEEYLTKSLGF